VQHLRSAIIQLAKTHYNINSNDSNDILDLDNEININNEVE